MSISKYFQITKTGKTGASVPQASDSNVTPADLFGVRKRENDQDRENPLHAEPKSQGSHTKKVHLDEAAEHKIPHKVRLYLRQFITAI